MVTNPLLLMWDANNFPGSLFCVFSLWLMVFNFSVVRFVISFFRAFALEALLKIFFFTFQHYKNNLLCFLAEVVKLYILAFRTLVNLDSIFIYDITYISNFIFSYG